MKNTSLLFLIFLGISISVNAQDKVIGDVKKVGNEFTVFDENGSRIGGMNAGGKLIGIGKDFFVVAKDGLLVSYNYQCKQLGGISILNAKVKVINNIITVTHDGDEMKFDRNFEKKH